MEELIAWLSSVDALWLYVIVFAVAYLENIFPPFPSDVVVVFVGSLVAIGKGTLALTVIAATAGSTLGFVTMYWLGYQFGERVLEAGRIKFISHELIQKVHAWFGRYGYWVVIANRFLSGTRAVISFCTGIAEMNLVITTILSAASALLWNSILVASGYAVGDNWRMIGDYMDTYSRIITVVVLLALAIWGVRVWWKSRARRNGAANGKETV